MDLNLLDAAPTEAEREAIDAVVGEEAGSSNRVGRADRTRRHLLLPALRAAQLRVGWVSEGALGYASRRLSVPVTTPMDRAFLTQRRSSRSTAASSG